MEARGFEPLTSGLQSPRSANWATPPSKFQISNLKLERVGLSRFELLTSRLSGVRSNQLSYRPLGHFCRKIKPLGLWVKWLYRIWLNACSYCWRRRECYCQRAQLKYQLSIALTLHHSSDISKLDRTVLNDDLKISWKLRATWPQMRRRDWLSKFL
jgi:hypothetical protein